MFLKFDRLIDYYYITMKELMKHVANHSETDSRKVKKKYLRKAVDIHGGELGKLSGQIPSTSSMSLKIYIYLV